MAGDRFLGGAFFFVFLQGEIHPIMELAFAKYEGAGNDFLLIDNRDGAFAADAARIASLCDRHFGVGADGLMTLSADSRGNCVMHYYNADGSEGEMCGNGARCFVLFAAHLGLAEGDTFCFTATDGPHEAILRSTTGAAGEIELGMIPVERIEASGDGWFLNTGVPHYVEFVDSVEEVDVVSRGRALRYDAARFPQGTNVNFARILGDGRIRMRTYERGVENETLACGTGATAVALVTNFVHQPAVNRFALDLPGGQLQVQFGRTDKGAYEEIRLTGPARRVFTGTIQIDQ